MKNVITVFLAFCSVYGYSQNLVPNPSFEEYLECPFSTAELQNQVVDWYSWSITPDYFNRCSNDIDGFVGVPSNAWGYQESITGDGYAGLFTYDYSDTDIREYIAAPLNENLIIGNQYYIMFYTSMYDGGEEDESWCATNHIGLRFFKNPTYNNENNAFQPDNYAHLDHSNLLNDTSNWTLVEGWFTADDNYNWIALGNFFDDQNTTIEILNPEDRCYGIYYIENICVGLEPADCSYLVSTKTHLEQSSVKIYPNPVIDNLYIESADEILTKIELFDFNGQIILSESVFQNSRKQINVTDLSQGVYFLRIHSNKDVLNEKIIIL